MDWTAVDRARVDRRGPRRGRRLGDLLAPLCVVADIGLQRAGGALSEMSGTPVQAVAAQVRRVPLPLVPWLVGGPEAAVATTYLKVRGSVDGHVVLVLRLRAARRLIAMILGEPPGNLLHVDDVARSVLGEVGNVVGSFFLAALADSARVEIAPSPPMVIVDMCGAALDPILAELGKQGDHVLVIDTVFRLRGQQAKALFLMLCAQRHFDLLLEKLPR